MSNNLFEIITTSLNNISIKEKVELFKQLYLELAGKGTCGDTELVHINTYEASVLRSLGGAGTLNEVTGLKQYMGGSPPPPPSNQTVSQTAEIPAEMKPYVTDILGQAQAINKQRTEEGYKPYEGQQIADFTPEQRQAFTGVSGLVGSGQQYFDAAKGFVNQAATAPTAEMTQQFMSPYMQNVVAIQQREAARVGDVAAQELAGKAARGGAFGGSRQAILEAEGARNLQTQFGDIQAKGLQTAYSDAQKQMGDLANRQLQAGTQMANLGTAAPAEAAREFAALANVGQQQQQQAQQALDISMGQYEQERTFPERNLQNYSSIIRGFPLAPSSTSNSQTTTPAPSMLSQVGGLAALGLGTAGAFGAFKSAAKGGKVGGKGGIKSIVVKRRKGGTVNLQEGGLPAGELTQVELLAQMSTPELMQQVGFNNPTYSSDLVAQEVAKRNKDVTSQVPEDSDLFPAKRSPRERRATLEMQNPITSPNTSSRERPVVELSRQLFAKPTITPDRVVYEEKLTPDKLPPKKAPDVRINAGEDTSDPYAMTNEATLTGPSRTLGASLAAPSLLNSIPAKVAAPAAAAAEKEESESQQLKNVIKANQEKRLGLLQDQKSALESQKYLPFVNLGASILAKGGGKPFLQTVGSAVTDSGFVKGLTDNQAQQASIAEKIINTDEETLTKVYNISGQDAKQLIAQQKLLLEGLGVKARQDTADAALKSAEARAAMVPVAEERNRQAAADRLAALDERREARLDRDTLGAPTTFVDTEAVLKSLNTQFNDNKQILKALKDQKVKLNEPLWFDFISSTKLMDPPASLVRAYQSRYNELSKTPEGRAYSPVKLQEIAYLDVLGLNK